MSRFIKVVALLGIVTVGVGPIFALAQDTIPTVFTNLTDFKSYIGKLGNFLFTILLAIAILFIIWAAFKYLTSQGDPEKVKSASTTLIYALVAIVVALVSRGLVTLVQTFFSSTR